MDLLRESASKYKYYASGRRFVEGLLVTLDLRPRQDVIMGYLVNSVLPQDDIIDIEVCSCALSAPMQQPATCQLPHKYLVGMPRINAGHES